VVFSSECVSRV